MIPVLAALTFALPSLPIADLRDGDQEAIHQAALDYVDGFYAADPERVERGVHPSLQKVVVRSMPGGRETLDFMDRHALVEYARMGAGKRPEGERQIEVSVLDVLENTAVVRIDSISFVDHAHVVRVNDAWRVVNVLWAQKSGQELAAVGENDRAAIEQAGLDYVDGFYAGSTERLQKALHPRLQKVTVQALPNGREVFRYTTTDGLVEYVNTGQSEKPRPSGRSRSRSSKPRATSPRSASTRWTSSTSPTWRASTASGRSSTCSGRCGRRSRPPTPRVRGGR